MFNKYYKKVDRKTLHELEVPELIELSMELHQGIFPSWSPPIINDFYVMMMNGKVARRLAKLGLENPIALQNNLMAGEENIESTEPTKYLLSMTELVREDKELEAIFSQNTDSQIMPLLKSSFPKFHELAQNYIELYGDRCIGELKLESITMREDPSFMFAVIRNFLKKPDLNLETIAQREGALRSDAEKQAFGEIRKQMGYISLWLFKRDLVRLREAVKIVKICALQEPEYLVYLGIFIVK